MPPEAASGAAVVAPLERERELAVMDDLLRGIRDGRGWMLLFEGAAGLGKTALLDWGAAAGGAAGLEVLRAGGHELERGFAWGVARSLFERSLSQRAPAERERLFDGPAAAARVLFGEGGLRAETPWPDAGFAIVHALYWLALRLADRTPLLVVVDDVHWVDDPSLRWLIYLSARVAKAPIGVLAAARSAEPGAAGLLDVLADDPRARVSTVRPLSAAAVSRLVCERLPGAGVAVCRRSFELTAGNPLYLRALLAAVEPAGPELGDADLSAGATAAARALTRSVLRRVDALGTAARRLAEAVAVFEDDVPLALAAGLAELEPADARTAADDLARNDLLCPGDPVGFTHPLLRTAVYGGLPGHLRGATHKRAALLLGATGAVDEQVCAHLLEASPAGDAEVVQRLRATARRALGQGAPSSAVAYLERALREPPDEPLRPVVLAELGEAEATAGRPEAVRHLEAAIALVGDGEARARLLLEFGRALHHSGRLSEACAAFRRGSEELGAGDTGLRIDLDCGYMNAALFVPDRSRDAQRRARAIMAAAERPTHDAERALLSAALMAEVWAAGQRERVLSAAHWLLAEGRLTQDDAAGSQAAWHVVSSLGWCDDFGGAEGALRVAFADAARRGSVLAYVLACVFRSRHALWTGRIDDAVHDGRTALELAPPSSVYRFSATYCLVSGLLEQGLDGEVEVVMRAIDRAPPAPPFFAAWGQMAAGRLAAARGDHAVALDAFLTAGRSHAALGIVNPAVLPWRSEAADAARRLDQLDRARELVDEELALAEGFGAPRAIGVARRAAAALERPDRAVGLLRSASDTLAGCGARVEQCRALTDLGAALRRAGQPREARTVLQDAAELAEQVGAARSADRARTELRAAGGRVSTRAGGRGGHLTPGERRVAELAAAGQTNRQIANALFITVKAVEWHLRNTYRKLAIPGRAELAGALAAEPPHG